MARTYLKSACWCVAAFGTVVFALLLLDLVQPALWTGLAVILVLPAFVAAAIMVTNDFLRKRGFEDAHIPTAKTTLVPSLVTMLIVGFAASLVAGLIIYLML